MFSFGKTERMPDQHILLAGVDSITLRAQTPGGVIFTGDTFLRFAGDHSVVSGFEFQIPDDIDPKKPNELYYRTNVIQFRGNDNDDQANHSRINNCRIVDMRTGPSYRGGHNWIAFYGRGNQVDNCSFEGKRSEKSLIVFVFDVETGGSDRGGDHVIRRNYFGNRPVLNPADKNVNEWEIIRIGDSSSVSLNTKIVVADNLFEKCNGELETISNKSSGNRYLNNTFRDNNGQLTIRQGNDCLIEGNFFLGTGSKLQSGIRITGENHVVVNNYFENLKGTGKRAVLSLVAGQENWDGSGDGSYASGYRPVSTVLIAHNTIVNAKRPFEFGADKSKRRDKAPTKVNVINNAVFGSGSHALLTYTQPESDIRYTGNIMYHTDGKNKLISGASPSLQATEINFTDPDLQMNSTFGYYRPTKKSPLRNAATKNVTEARQDILKNNRPDSNRTVGAEESWDATPNAQDRRPLVASDIGCHWGPNAAPK